MNAHFHTENMNTIHRQTDTHCYRTPFICKTTIWCYYVKQSQPTISRAVRVIVIVSSYGCLMVAYCKCIVRINDFSSFFLSFSFFLIPQFIFIHASFCYHHIWSVFFFLFSLCHTVFKKSLVLKTQVTAGQMAIITMGQQCKWLGTNKKKMDDTTKMPNMKQFKNCKRRFFYWNWHVHWVE